VPKIFLHTIHTNLSEEKAMALFCYNEPGIKLVIGCYTALQKGEGTKNLSISAESWHGSVCNARIDNNVKTLKFAMPLHADGEKEETRFRHAMEMWHGVFLFSTTPWHVTVKMGA
jgi:hypothetical protein